MKKSKNAVAGPEGVKLTAEQLKQHKILLDEKQATQALENRHAAKIQSLCREVIEATIATGKVYLKLCLYIRENMVAPKLVSHEMAEMGFNKQVISRVNKVANASDEVFSQFAASTIGFNKALDMARNPVQEQLAESMGTDVTDIKAQVAEMEADGSGAVEAEKLSDPEAVDAKWQKQFENGAAKALSAAAFFQWKKERKIEGGNGYILIVRRDAKWKPPVAPEAVKAENLKPA